MGNLLCAFLLLALSAFTYPGTAAVFVAVTMPFTLFFPRKLRDYVLSLLELAAIFAAALLLAAVYLKYMGSQRLLLEIHVGQMLRTLWGSVWGVCRDCFGLLPKYFFGATIVIAGCVNLVGILRRFRGAELLLQIVHLFVTILAITLCSLGMVLIGVGWLAARVIYPFGCLFGSLLMNYYLNIADREPIHADRLPGTERIVKMILPSLAAILLTIQFFSCEKVFIAKYQNDTADRYRISIIVQAVEDYERESGNVVEKIAFYSDENQMEQPNKVMFYSGDYVVSSFSTFWSRLSAISYYTGREFYQTEPEKDVQEYFSVRDWDTYSEDQLFFRGDTLHLCLY